jgi:hypothetical protein
MGQLAVDMSERGRGYGELLVQNAIKRCLTVRERELGISALLVDAYGEGAATFYEHYGFRRCRDKALGLYLPSWIPVNCWMKTALDQAPCQCQHRREIPTLWIAVISRYRMVGTSLGGRNGSIARSHEDEVRGT